MFYLSGRARRAINAFSPMACSCVSLARLMQSSPTELLVSYQSRYTKPRPALTVQYHSLRRHNA